MHLALTVNLYYTLAHMSIAASKKKRGRGRPSTGIGKATGLRLYPELEAGIEEWRRAQPDKPEKHEAMRRLMELALKRGK